MTAAHQLLLLRHAKSSWDGDRADEDRPLSARGRRDADAAGRWLAEHGPVPDQVLCSIAARTRETWARAAAGDPRLSAAPVSYRDAIYQAWPDALLALVRALPETVGTALLVGHAPGLPDLANRLNRLSGTRELDTPTCTLLGFSLDGPWAATGPKTARLNVSEVLRG